MMNQKQHLVTKHIKQMKNLINIVFVFAIIACKAQSPVIPLYNSPIDETSGCYIKDMDNDLSPFEGTWKWENGNNTLVIQFQKIEMYHQNDNPYYNYYKDYLIANYKYIENGVELTNTLPLSFNGDIEEHPIWGGGITQRAIPPCPECDEDTRFVWTSFGELENPQLYGKIVMAHFVENGVEKIRARIFNSGIYNKTAQYTGPLNLKVPEGIYTFIKQD